jgi:hypothetical protein
MALSCSTACCAEDALAAELLVVTLACEEATEDRPYPAGDGGVRLGSPPLRPADDPSTLPAPGGLDASNCIERQLKKGVGAPEQV